MIALSPRAEEVIDFLRTHMRAHGHAPSQSKIAMAIGLASSSTMQIRVALVELERAGLILRINKEWYGIELVEAKYHNAANCPCGDCASRRFGEYLKIVEGLQCDPEFPPGIKLDNIRLLSCEKRAAALDLVQPLASGDAR